MLPGWLLVFAGVPGVAPSSAGSASHVACRLTWVVMADGGHQTVVVPVVSMLPLLCHSFPPLLPSSHDRANKASTLVHTVIIISACHNVDTDRACRLSTSSQETQARDSACAQFHYAIRRRTHQIASASSPTASATRMPASMLWNGQKRSAGW